MLDLGYISTVGAAVNTKYTFDWSKSRALAPLARQPGGLSDNIMIYNGSGCVFMGVCSDTGRQFTLPPNSWYGPIPISYRGSWDNGLSLAVQYVTFNQTIPQVHFDYFYPGEPVIIPQTLGNPNVIPPATTIQRNGVSPTATATWTQLGSGVTIGNYPFGNSAILAGLATSGQFSILVYAIHVTVKGNAMNGTTIEGGQWQARLVVVDSGGTNVTTFFDGSAGDFYDGWHGGLSGGAGNWLGTLQPSQPLQVGVVVTAGAGAPYKIRGEVEVINTVGLTAPNLGTIFVVMYYGISPYIYNAAV